MSNNDSLIFLATDYIAYAAEHAGFNIMKLDGSTPVVVSTHLDVNSDPMLGFLIPADSDVI